MKAEYFTQREASVSQEISTIQHRPAAEGGPDLPSTDLSQTRRQSLGRSKSFSLERNMNWGIWDMAP
jgi:hypothetical protein